MSDLALLRRLVHELRSIASGDDDWWDFGRGLRVDYVSAQPTPTSFIFATKRCWAEAIGDIRRKSLGVFVRPGLLLPSHAKFIAKKMGSARELFFLGDADPFDLTVFCSLRIRMTRLSPSYRVNFGGIGDHLIELSSSHLSARHYPSIPLKAFEANHWRLLCETFPALPMEIGARAAALLEGGKKVESEALTNMVFYREDYGSALRQALLSRIRVSSAGGVQVG